MKRIISSGKTIEVKNMRAFKMGFKAYGLFMEKKDNPFLNENTIMASEWNNGLEFAKQLILKK